MHKCSLLTYVMILMLAAAYGCGGAYDDRSGGSPSGDTTAGEGTAGADSPGGPASGPSVQQRMESLKRIARAMHNHHDTYKCFPTAAIRGAGGEPLLSWRVAILPFLGQKTLFDQFHLDEPWDSPHNSQLVERMPDVYRSIGDRKDGSTSFLVFVGGSSVFDREEGPRVAEIRDGTSNTLLCVEAGPDKAVPWSKPEDLPVAESNPMAALGRIGEDGFLAALCDGSVRQIRKDIDSALFRSLITCDGGEPFVW